jgi:hypothetical protein
MLDDIFCYRPECDEREQARKQAQDEVEGERLCRFEARDEPVAPFRENIQVPLRPGEWLRRGRSDGLPEF